MKKKLGVLLLIFLLSTSLSYASDDLSRNIINLERKEDIAIHTEWKIEFNRSFKMEELFSISIKHKDEFIPTKIEILKNNSIKITPVDDYEYETDYSIKIALKNGNQYNMDFKTEKDTLKEKYFYGVVSRTYADMDRVRIYTSLDGKHGQDTIFRMEREENLAEPKVLVFNEIGEMIEKEARRIDVLGQVVRFKINKNGYILESEFAVMDNESIWRIDHINGENINIVNTSIEKPELKDIKSLKIDENTLIINAEGLRSTEINSYPMIDADDFNIVKYSEFKNSIEEEHISENIEFYIFTTNDKIDSLILIGDSIYRDIDESVIYSR